MRVTVEVSVEREDGFRDSKVLYHDQAVLKDKKTFDSACYNCSQALWDELSLPSQREWQNWLVAKKAKKRAAYYLMIAIMSFLTSVGVVIGFLIGMR